VQQGTTDEFRISNEGVGLCGSSKKKGKTSGEKELHQKRRERRIKGGRGMIEEKKMQAGDGQLNSWRRGGGGSI